MHARPADRRARTRESLFSSRRRFARVQVACSVFYESERRSLVLDRAEVSLRSLSLPTRFPDLVGTRATVRVDAGRGPMIRLEVAVVRSRLGRSGSMALRVVSCGESDRLRLAALLLRGGGLQTFPHLDRRFSTLARAPRPLPSRRAA